MRLRRPSGSLVLAYLALFVAIGGVAWGAATVGPADIETNAVRSNHILDGEVQSADVADESTGFGLTSFNVLGDSLTTLDVDEATLFNDNSITGARISESTLGKVPTAATADTAANAQALQGHPVTDFITDRAGDLTFLEPIAISMNLNDSSRSVSLGQLTVTVHCTRDAITNAESVPVVLTTTATNTLVHNLVSHGPSDSAANQAVNPQYSEADDFDSGEQFSLTADGDAIVSVGNDQGTFTYLNPSTTAAEVTTMTYMAEAEDGKCQFAGIPARASLGS